MTLIIIIITAVISVLCFQNHNQLSKLLFVPYYMSEPKQWYRIITHGFVHADWTHLIFNMLSLYFAGQGAEYAIKMVKGESMANFYFIVLYLLGMIVACLPSFQKHRNNPGYRSLGASGAVAAVLFFFILFFPTQKFYMFMLPIPIPAWIYGLIYLVTEYYLDKRQNGHIAHDAHFFGAIFGILFAVVLYPNVLLLFVDQIRESLSF